MTVEKGEVIGIASLCSSEVLNIAPLWENETNLTSDSEFIGWESTNDSLPDLIPDSDSLPPLLSDFVEDSSDASQDFEPSPPYDPLGQFHTINGLHQPLNCSFFQNNLISGSEAQTLNLSTAELPSKQEKPSSDTFHEESTFTYEAGQSDSGKIHNRSVHFLSPTSQNQFNPSIPTRTI